MRARDTEPGHSVPTLPSLSLLRAAHIVIPTWNERDNVVALIDRLAELYGDPALHVWVVDDSSSDGTASAVRGLTERYPHVHLIERTTERGFGGACAAGMEGALKAGAEYVVMMDADFSHRPETLRPMLAAVEGCDLVIGSRYLDSSASVHDWPRWRLWLSRLGNAYIRSILGTQVRDATSGYRCWRAQALRQIPFRRQRSQGYAFQVETLYHARRAGLRFGEVRNDYIGRTRGTSKMTAGMILESLLLPLRLRWAELHSPPTGQA